MMIDNKKVKDDHKQGIERVKQRKGDMEVGQGGSMSKGWNHGKGGDKDKSFRRSDGMTTPRRA